MKNRVAVEVRNLDDEDFFLSPVAKTTLVVAARPPRTGNGLFTIREKVSDGGGRISVHPNLVVYVDGGLL